MAIAQNVGTAASALLPALFVAVAPPGSNNIPLVVGGIAFGVTLIAALAAWSARETYRIPMNLLGKRDAVPVPKREYDQMRTQLFADASRDKSLARNAKLQAPSATPTAKPEAGPQHHPSHRSSLETLRHG
jgi:Na+/melibiose symporter-like transporter